MISGSHAVFRYGEGGLCVLDDGSLNGVIVNGERCETKQLGLLDVIRLGRSLWVVTDDVLWEGEIRTAISEVKKELAEVSGKPRQPVTSSRESIPSSRPAKHFKGNRLVIDIDERSVWKNFKKRVLLSNVHLTVEPGDMVLILGGSGAGKTTFMNAVMGYEPARGRVVYNNVDIYNEYKKMMFEIGYVPQQELIRVNETVHHTLLNAAHMKLAAGMPPYAYEEAVDRTLSVLGLEREKQSMVSKLSGGQKKRLSIAVEYIGNPSLFFLDEPDSGLDGSMASGLMQNLRMIADEGKIVMVISHYPDRTPELFNKIIVLAKDTRDNCGHLVFFGSPNEAKQFFETDTIEAIVKRINRPDEDGEGMGDYFIEKFRNYRGY